MPGKSFSMTTQTVTDMICKARKAKPACSACVVQVAGDAESLQHTSARYHIAPTTVALVSCFLGFAACPASTAQALPELKAERWMFNEPAARTALSA